MKGTFRSIDNSHHPLYRNLLREEMSNVNDSLPAYLYKKIEDSIRYKIIKENVDIVNGGAGWKTLSFGTNTYEYENRKEHFLEFDGYEMSTLNYFYRKNGMLYMHYLDKKDGFSHKEINIKFIHKEGSNKGSVFIPTNEKVINTLNIIHPIIAILMLAIAYYFILVPIFKILYNIAKGNAFNDENIGGLLILSWVLIAFGLIPGVFSIISHFSIKTYLPPQISFSYFDALMVNWTSIALGLIIMLVAKAFRNGQKLQEEQSLTV